MSGLYVFFIPDSDFVKLIGIFTPVKYAVDISAFSVKGVITSPDCNTLGLTTRLESDIISAKSRSNSIRKLSACWI
ncbi:MAG: hypothetical protein ACI8WT_000899 [Clostridium sp.]|jgi:hypothetical protein